MSAGSVSMKAKKRSPRSGDRRTDFEDYNGIGFQSPGLAFTLSLFMLSLLGLPLTAGFMGLLVFGGATVAALRVQVRRATALARKRSEEKLQLEGQLDRSAKLEADEARPVGASVTSDVTERRFTKTGQPSKSNQNARSAQDRPRLRVAAARSTGGRLAR